MPTPGWNDLSWLEAIHDLIKSVINAGDLLRVKIIEPLSGGGSVKVDVNEWTTPGTEFLGYVGGKTIVKDVVLVLDTAQYADEDVMVVPQEITGAVRANGKHCLLQSLSICDTDDQGGAFDLYLSGQQWAWGAAINVQVAISDGQAKLLATRIPIAAADYTDLGANRIVYKGAADAGMGVVIEPPNNSTSIWIGAISQDTKTYTASGITLKLGLLQLD